MAIAKDLTNQRFNRLTVLRRGENTKRGQIQWVCECDCKNIVTVEASRLKSGKTKSCGCYQKETVSKIKKKHGMCAHPLYSIWEGMKERCNNPKHKAYSNYGGRGIKICAEWESFTGFYEWAKHGYAKGLTLDREDNNKGYEPSNCRWITYAEQMHNTSRNVPINYNGRTMDIEQWSKELGIKYDTLYARLFRYKWTVEKSFTTPVRIRR